eukprot:scaffold216427_cov21-Prasinocladus_malaysianus.AAC.1
MGCIPYFDGASNGSDIYRAPDSRLLSPFSHFIFDRYHSHHDFSTAAEFNDIPILNEITHNKGNLQIMSILASRIPQCYTNYRSTVYQG